MAKKNPLHNAAGKKIIHPADAQRKKFKKQKLEKMKKERHQHFETKMFGKSPEEIEHEIMAMKFDHERKRAHKIAISKIQQDRLTKLEAGYKKLKEEIDARHKKRLAAPKSNLHVDFEELKVHRKSSIFYHPVTNPYGAPPNGQTLMYRHPDGSVKREPPPVAEDERPEAPGFGGASSSSAAGPARRPPGFGSEDEEDEDEDADEDEEGGGVVIAGAGASEEESDDEEDDDDEDAEPMLPTVLPDGSSLPTLPPGPPPGHGAAGLPPLPPGPPPGSSGRAPLPPGMPPLPPGQPPLPSGQPPLPPGMPPLPTGMPPLPPGMPPLPLGMPPLPAGMPPLPAGMPPLPAGMPPLPAGMPPLPAGMPPLPMGQPPLPFGQPHASSRLQPKLPPGMPPLPAGIPPLGPPPDAGAVLGAGPKSGGGAPAPGSQAAFIADLQQAGVQLPPGTKLPLAPGGPPGPPPKAAAGAGLAGKAAPPGPPPKAEPPTVSDLPAGIKAPPPPPKKPPVAASVQASGPGVSRAATAFVPTALRTKRASAVAGGVIQVSSASLSLEKRQRTLFTEAPKVAEKIDMDDAFEDFMKEIG